MEKSGIRLTPDLAEVSLRACMTYFLVDFFRAERIAGISALETSQGILSSTPQPRCGLRVL